MGPPAWTERPWQTGTSAGKSGWNYNEIVYIYIFGCICRVSICIHIQDTYIIYPQMGMIFYTTHFTLEKKQKRNSEYTQDRHLGQIHPPKDHSSQKTPHTDGKSMVTPTSKMLKHRKRKLHQQLLWFRQNWNAWNSGKSSTSSTWQWRWELCNLYIYNYIYISSVNVYMCFWIYPPGNQHIPPKMAFWRWCSFSQVGYVNSLEGISFRLTSFFGQHVDTPNNSIPMASMA